MHRCPQCGHAPKCDRCNKQLDVRNTTGKCRDCNLALRNASREHIAGARRNLKPGGGRLDHMPTAQRDEYRFLTQQKNIPRVDALRMVGL